MRKNKLTVFCLIVLTALVSSSAGSKAGQVRCIGKVVDAQAQPIAGAKVASYEMVSDGVAGNIMLRQVSEMITRTDGAFVFATEPRPVKGTFLDGYIVATKQPLALGWAIWNMREDAQVAIELGKPEKLEGVIVDEAGEPVVGAEVRANLLRTKRTATGEDEKEWLPGIAPIDWLGTETNSEGKFQFDNIPEDSGVDLLVTADGKASVYTYQWGPAPRFKGGAGSLFKAGQRGIKVVLPAEARIEGRVVENNSGKGVGGLTLAMSPHFSPAFFDRFYSVSKEDGTFSIGSLQSGEYLISGDFPSFDIDVKSGRSTDVLIGLNPQRVFMPREEETGKSGTKASIQISLKILEVPEDVEMRIFKQDESPSSGMFVRIGQEYAGRLLGLSQDTKSARLISSPNMIIYDGREASISQGDKMTYIAGYESARDGSDKLIAQHESLFAGGEYKIRGILKSGDRIHVKLTVKQQKPVFETRQYRKGYDYQIPLPAAYFSTDVITKNSEPVVIGCLGRDKPSLYLVLTTSLWSPPREPDSLIGKPLPSLDNIKTEFNLKQAEGKQILLCLWDMEQRPSRNCIRELAKQAEQLKQSGVTVVAIQASKVDENMLNEWVKKQNIRFPIGMIQAEEENTCIDWGVRSLPWLILTDREHIVEAEGLALGELDEKLKQIDGD